MKHLHAILIMVLAACSASLADSPKYDLSDAWLSSSLHGVADDKPSFYATKVGATVHWRPAFSGPVRAKVFFHKLVHTPGNDTKVQLEVTTLKFVEKTDRVFVDCSKGETGWVELGEFDFGGRPTEGVKLTKISTGNTRVSGVRFDLLAADGKSVIQSLLLDTPTKGTGSGRKIERVVFTDLDKEPLKDAIESLATRGLAEPIAGMNFGPSEPITREDWAAWLMRAVYKTEFQPGAAARKPLTPDQKAAAIENFKRFPVIVGPGEMTRDRLLGSLAEMIWVDGVNVQWAGPWPANDSASARFARLGLEKGLTIDAKPTRAQAAALLWRYVQVINDASPVVTREWNLTFQDEFNGDKLNTDVWGVESGSPGHILSSRWPENVKVSDGYLHLLTKKEQRGGKEWTTGNIWTKTFKQKYGFFACRMRIAKASGLNNAFWLMTTNKKTDPVHFEIDITEAHYPSRHTMNLHQWAGTHTAKGKAWFAGEDLSRDFHVYALLWTEKEIVWYFDNHEVRREPNTFCSDKSPIRLSSAVGAWAGKITDAMDGTEMTVDWVRVYEAKD